MDLTSALALWGAALSTFLAGVKIAEYRKDITSPSVAGALTVR